MKGSEVVRRDDETDAVHGIVVHDRPAAAMRPRAAAFIWGTEPRPSGTLPFGRWRRAAGTG